MSETFTRESYPATDTPDTVTPTSSAADKGTEKDTHTFRVLRRDDTDDTAWNEEGTVEGPEYGPTANDVGEAYGEGHYLLIQQQTSYTFHSCYSMHVVAEKHYREARDGE